MVNKWVQSIKTIIFEDGSRVENPHFVCHHDENGVQLCGGMHYDKKGIAIGHTDDPGPEGTECLCNGSMKSLGHIDDPGIEGTKGYYCKKISDNEFEFVINIKADTPTKNGRIYPKEVLKKAIEEAQEKIKEGKLFGYLGAAEYAECPPINRASYVVKSLRMDDKYGQVYSEMCFLDTPNGKIGKDLITSGKSELTICSAGTIEGINVKECSILSLNAVPTNNQN